MNKKKLFLLSIIIFTFLLFRPSLSLDFISDDYFFLGIDRFRDITRYYSGFYHFIPVFWLHILIIKTVFAQNAAIFHLTGIIIHILNILMVFKIGQKIIKKNKISLIASLYFSAFFSHYEVLYWVTGQATTLMTLFYLSGIYFYISYINLKKMNYLIFYFIFFCCAFLTHEFALTLPFAAFVYFFIYAKKESLKIVFQTLIFPLTVAFLIFSLRILTAGSSLSPGSPQIFDIGKSIMKSLLYLFTSQPLIIDFMPDFALIMTVLIILNFLFFIKKSGTDRFLMLWAGIIIVLFSITGFPQARYFYLASIPVILFLANKISGLAKYGQFAIIILLISVNINFLFIQYISWKKSSEIIKNSKNYFYDNAFLFKQNQIITILNAPDSSNSGPWVAYIWRNGLDNYLQQEFKIDRENIYLKSNNAIYVSNLNFIYDPKVKKFRLLEK